jgi:hypothetical protein
MVLLGMGHLQVRLVSVIVPHVVMILTIIPIHTDSHSNIHSPQPTSTLQLNKHGRILILFSNEIPTQTPSRDPNQGGRYKIRSMKRISLEEYAKPKSKKDSKTSGGVVCYFFHSFSFDIDDFTRLYSTLVHRSTLLPCPYHYPRPSTTTVSTSHLQAKDNHNHKTTTTTKPMSKSKASPRQWGR